MVLQCLTWIPELIQNVLSHSDNNARRATRHLPDDIITDILRRLPAKSILTCRRVCKRWLALTSSPYFAKTHLKTTKPRLLVQICISSPPQKETEPFFFASDPAPRSNTKLKRMHSSRIATKQPYGTSLVGCCDGLVVLKPRYWGHIYYIFNPVIREEVIIKPPVPSSICGIFFHPPANEYRLIFSSEKEKDAGSDQYPIFVYGSKSKLWRQVATCPYQSAVSPSSVTFNGFLHWMTRADQTYTYELISAPCESSILTLSLEGDNFRALPHPGRQCPHRLQHKHMTLVEIEGQMSFCNAYEKVVVIWLLEDYDNWTWAIRYNIRLEWTVSVRKFPYIFASRVLESNYSKLRKRLCYIQNRELVIDWPNMGLFRCPLDSDIVTKFDQTIKELRERDLCHVFPYKPSFVSFNSC